MKLVNESNEQLWFRVEPGTLEASLRELKRVLPKLRWRSGHSVAQFRKCAGRLASDSAVRPVLLCVEPGPHLAWDDCDDAPATPAELARLTARFNPPPRIGIPELKEAGACAAGLRWFRKTFAGPVPPATLAAALRAEGRNGWADWLAENLSCA